MNRKTKAASMTVIISLCTLAASVPPIALAAISQPSSAISSAGGSGTTASYTNFGVIGQGQPVGAATSSNYQNDAGFLPVLGGWKLLYPIIAVNPATITFNVIKDGTASQPAAMTNDGGSTLKWSAASNQSWLTVTPASGTGGSSLNVTATSSSFTPGLYEGKITLTGNGAQGATILVTMNVSNLYGLTVTITSDTDNVYGTVTGDGGIACQSGDLPTSSGCYKTFAPATVVTLAQTPVNSTFGGWPAVCSVNNGACQLTMNSSKNVGVAYTPDLAKVQVSGDAKRYYAIETALDASNGSDVRALATLFTEPAVIMSTPAAIRLKGGYSDGFASQNGYTTIDGSLKVQKGTLRVEKVKLK